MLTNRNQQCVKSNTRRSSRIFSTNETMVKKKKTMKVDQLIKVNITMSKGMVIRNKLLILIILHFTIVTD